MFCNVLYILVIYSYYSFTWWVAYILGESSLLAEKIALKYVIYDRRFQRSRRFILGGIYVLGEEVPRILYFFLLQTLFTIYFIYHYHKQCLWKLYAPHGTKRAFPFLRPNITCDDLFLMLYISISIGFL